jgi:membrane fusion protein
MLSHDIAERRSELELAEHERRSLPDKHSRELSDLAIARNTLLQNRYEQQGQARYVVRAPIPGRIGALQGTVGESLSSSAPVVSIVPENAALVANLLAPSRAIGFLTAHADVNLLIDAFPYQKFGVQRGRITEISESAYKPGELNVPVAYDESVHKIVVALQQSSVSAYGKQVPLQVDMTLTGELIVDRRSLFEWMFAPIYSVRL